MSNPEIDKYGNKFWINEYGQIHREGGPAKEFSNGTKYWYQNGRKHRADGPAIEYADGYKAYFINGKKYDSLEEGLMEEALR